MPFHKIDHLFKSYMVHDDEKCYCKDTIVYLMENEKKYYDVVGNVDLNDNIKNEKFLTCKFSKLRQRLIEWLISIQDFFRSGEETLEMAIRLFNFIYFKGIDSTSQNQSSNENVDILLDRCTCGDYHSGLFKYKELLLIALTCFFLSCKFCERFAPKVSKLIVLTNDEFNEQELVEKEKEILSILNFDLKIPLISQFLQFYIIHDKRDILHKEIHICYYLSNIVLSQPKFLKYAPSSLAASILALSRLILIGISPSMFENENMHNSYLYKMEHFLEILEEIWNEFIHSFTVKDSYKVQKNKFLKEHHNNILIYLEQIDLKAVAKHLNELKARLITV